jgi:hypothetical protein
MSAGVDENEPNIEDGSNQLAEAYQQMNLAVDAKLDDLKQDQEDHDDLEGASSDTSPPANMTPDNLLTDDLLTALHIHANIHIANFQQLIAESDLEKAIRMFPSPTTNEQHEWTFRILRLKARRRSLRGTAILAWHQLARN